MKTNFYPYSRVSLSHAMALSWALAYNSVTHIKAIGIVGRIIIRKQLHRGKNIHYRKIVELITPTSFIFMGNSSLTSRAQRRKNEYNILITHMHKHTHTYKAKWSHSSRWLWLFISNNLLWSLQICECVCVCVLDSKYTPMSRNSFLKFIDGVCVYSAVVEKRNWVHFSKRWENIFLSLFAFKEEKRKKRRQLACLARIIFVISSSDHTAAHFLEYLTSIEYSICDSF